MLQNERLGFYAGGKKGVRRGSLLVQSLVVAILSLVVACIEILRLKVRAVVEIL